MELPCLTNRGVAGLVSQGQRQPRSDLGLPTVEVVALLDVDEPERVGPEPELASTHLHSSARATTLSPGQSLGIIEGE